jgi:hypothetical protein
LGGPLVQVMGWVTGKVSAALSAAHVRRRGRPTLCCDDDMPQRRTRITRSRAPLRFPPLALVLLVLPPVA